MNDTDSAQVTFSKWLKSAMTLRKLTRRGLASDLGLSKACVDSWLSGRTYPKVAELYGVCTTLWELESETNQEYLKATRMIVAEKKANAARKTGF